MSYWTNESVTRFAGARDPVEAIQSATQQLVLRAMRRTGEAHPLTHLILRASWTFRWSPRWLVGRTVHSDEHQPRLGLRTPVETRRVQPLAGFAARPIVRPGRDPARQRRGRRQRLADRKTARGVSRDAHSGRGTALDRVILAVDLPALIWAGESSNPQARSRLGTGVSRGLCVRPRAALPCRRPHSSPW
jgi:hypothetical protein